jgi:beta-xylosidase
MNRKFALFRILGGTLVVALLAAFLGGVGGAQAAGAQYRFDDSFDNATLHPLWAWHNEVPEMWSLGDGNLRIWTSPGAAWSQNMLLMPVTNDNFEIRTSLKFLPQKDFQFAGLVVYQDDGNYLLFGRSFCDSPRPACVGNGIYFDNIVGGVWTGSNFATRPEVPGRAQLMLRKQGSTLKGYFSVQGDEWRLIGSHTLSAGFHVNGVGLFSAQNFYGNPPVLAEFSKFSLTGSLPALRSTAYFNFKSGSLGTGWGWLNPGQADWTIKKYVGLTIYTSPLGNWDQNLLLRDLPTGDFMITTPLKFAPTSNFQGAGLAVYEDPLNFLAFIKAFCDSSIFFHCVDIGLYLDSIVSGTQDHPNFATSLNRVNPNAVITLSLLRQGERWWAFYQLPGSSVLWLLGMKDRPGFNPVGIGLNAANDSGDFRLPATFGSFTVKY